jgi:hypothetical protein
MNTGPWSLTLADEHVSEQAVERWNREPEWHPARQINRFGGCG